MLITLINWIYIFVTCYLIGFFLLPRLSRLIDPDSRLNFNWCDMVICGMVTATLYAEVFSLFTGVDLLANVILIIACLIFLYVDRTALAGRLQALRPAVAKRRASDIPVMAGGLVLFVLVLMYTARSSFHYDTGLYHAQAIHWIEDYGIIKGLGWLHVRLAYNSAYFPLCALYSFRSITGGQSLHSVSGFIFAVMILYSIYGWCGRSSKSPMTVIMRIAPVFYFLVCMLEITSPESDYIAANLIIWVFIRLVEIYKAENDGNKLAAYCLMAICTFSLIGYKLSAAVFPVITIWPLVIMIRKKKWKGIGVCAALAVSVVLPYLIRNVIICGWLIYPLDSIDLFNTWWKFPKEVVSSDASEIADWARLSETEGTGLASSFGWIIPWWQEQFLATKMFISSLLISIPVMLVTLFGRKDRFIKFLLLTLVGSVIFYLLKAPLIRYCYGPVLILPLMVIGLALEHAFDRFKTLSAKGHAPAGGVILGLSVIASAAIVAPSIYSSKELIKFDYEETFGRFPGPPPLIKQIDYPQADVREVDWYGYTVYLPQEGDQCWYYSFPSSPYHECFDYTRPVDNDLKKGVMNKNLS